MTSATPVDASTPWTEISEQACLAPRPVVSILMVAYNHGPYLAEAIGGVLLQQRDFPIELLIGDDCSQDDTLEVAQRYQRMHPDLIRVITSTRNVGYHANFQRLARFCRGEYIALCEGDDYWIDPNKLAAQVRLLGSDEGVAIVHTDHVFREDFWGRAFHTMPRGRFSMVRDTRHLAGDFSECFFTALYTHTSTVMFRGEQLKEYLRTDLAALEGAFLDRCLLNYLAIKGRVAYMEQPTSAYRVWVGSITRSNLSTATTLWRWQLEYFEMLHRQVGLYASSVTAIRKHFSKAIARNAFRTGDRKLFNEYRERLLAMVPTWQERGWIRCLTVAIRFPLIRVAVASSARIVAYVKTTVRRVKILVGLIPRERLFANKEGGRCALG